MARSWMCILVLALPALAFADQGDPAGSPVSGGSAAAGGAHSILSFPDGRVVSWGKGSQGQLGTGERRARSTAAPVQGLSDITVIAAGSAHTLARSAAGVVYAWGANDFGQLGDGTVSTRTRPVPVLLLENVVAIAAGRSHSLALTADGRVFAWGSNDQGQLGLGSTIDVSIPTEITLLSEIVAIAAGHSHSLAITRTGALFVWGNNAHGQLGDGSRTARVTPRRINLDAVVAVAAGRSHSLALLRNGDVYSWGRGTSGQLGTGSTKLETTPTLIAGLKAIAIEAGAQFSGAVRADRVLVTWGANKAGQLGDGSTINRLSPVAVPGLTEISTLSMGDTHTIAVTSDGSVWTWGSGKSGRLGTSGRDNQPAPTTTISGIPHWGPALGEVAAPTIHPAGGLYDAAQTVTLESESAFADVRYTLDGTEPTSQSPLYSQPFVVATATTVRARAFSTFGDSASATVTSVFSFQYGDLAAPLIRPSGGTFTKAPEVTITAPAGASIRYTFDGTDPDLTSTLYQGPVQVPAAGAQLKARAWHVDWRPSAIVSETYVTDVTPPTIVAEVSPPLVDGWMTTPVTVTFVCADDSGAVSCSAPVVVDTDGRDQLITGTATDTAGNQASTSVIVSMDLRGPEIALMDSPDNSTVAESSLSLNVLVTDAGSGVDRLLCNGSSVDLSAGVAECVVPLRPGLNSITLQANDLVGHVGSVGLTVTRVGVPSALQLTPAHRTMLVDEVALFSLRDDFGALVTGAAWTSSDESVIALSSDDPPQVSAIAPGTATISVQKDGLMTEATVNVVAGVALAPGTEQWRVTPTPGHQLDLPLYTTRVDASIPPLFIVEKATDGQAILYAATPEGEVLWRQDSPGVPLMGDSFGGVIAGVLGEFQHSQYRALLRLGNAGGVAPWRYDSPGNLLAPAQALDGTIYAVEFILGSRQDGSEVLDKYATVIDGRTGRLLNRTLLAREKDTWITTTSGCRDRRSEEPPQHAGPVVGPDGRGYLAVRRYERTKMLLCFDEPRAPRTIDLGVDLLVMSAAEPPAVESLHSAQCVGARGELVVCDAAVDVRQIVPDGIGGILTMWRRATHLTGLNTLFLQTSIARRIDTGTFVDLPVAEGTSIYSVGQAGTAILVRQGTFNAFDVTTGATKWSMNSTGGWLIASAPDGGAAFLHPTTGELSHATSTGQIEEAPVSTALITANHQFGGWMGVSRDGELTSVTGTFQDATRWHPGAGNLQRNLRLSVPGAGIHVKSHTVQAPIVYQHTSIRITPTFQEFWRQLKPNDFVNRDEFGNFFMTIGAGTADGDSSVFCIGALTKGINRTRDVSATPVKLEPLPVGPLEEVRLINDFYVYFGNYKNDLEYACIPELHPGKFNSNSFVRGLLEKAGAPLPLFPTRGNIAPGWSTPVPPDKFNP